MSEILNCKWCKKIYNTSYPGMALHNIVSQNPKVFTWEVQCSNWKCNVKSKECATEADAIRDWNTKNAE